MNDKGAVRKEVEDRSCVECKVRGDEIKRLPIDHFMNGSTQVLNPVDKGSVITRKSADCTVRVHLNV